jgi:hypothetical protein
LLAHGDIRHGANCALYDLLRTTYVNVFGFLALLVFFLPPYAGAFGLLAFLPRWRWLLPAAALAAVACILVGRKLSMHEARFGPGLDVLLLITVGFGFTAGFIARASLLIAQAYRPHWARPNLILPIAFVATPLVFVGLIEIPRSLQAI